MDHLSGMRGTKCNSLAFWKVLVDAAISQGHFVVCYDDFLLHFSRCTSVEIIQMDTRNVYNMLTLDIIKRSKHIVQHKTYKQVQVSTSTSNSSKDRIRIHSSTSPNIIL